MSAAPPSLLRRIFGLELLDNRYPSLHGIRVLAIVSVVQLHSTWFLDNAALPLDPWFKGTSLHLFFGMDLFFVLSGFLIGSILLHSLEHQGKQQLRRFYLRRIFRTFPSYWVVLTFLSIVLPLTLEQKQHLVYEYVYVTNFLNLGKTSVVMPWGWSLALEEQFYLAVPLLFFLLWKLRSGRARVIVLVCLTASAGVIRLGYYFIGAPWRDREIYEALYFRTHTRFDTLIAGVLLAVVHRTWGAQIGAWLKAAPFHRAVILLPSLALAWLVTNPTLLGDEPAMLIRVLAWGSLTSLFLFGVVTLLLHGEGWFHDFLSRPIFRRLATLGYGVYLVHIPIIHHVVVPITAEIQKQGHSMLLLWPATVASVLVLSAAAAYVLHVVVEKPSLRIREKLAA